MFYKRQFSTYNYCIYEGRTGHGTMHLWHENEANRGSNEVVSIIHNYIITNFNPLPPNQSRTLTIWSDRCTGQTNNYIILCYFKYIMSKSYFTTINQKFMHTGHSFMPCDRLFALIEKKKKTATVNVPDDWIDVIRSARVNNPFTMIRMTQGNIYNIKNLCSLVPKPHDLKVTEFQWFRLTKQEPHLFLARKGFGPTPLVWKEFEIRAPNQRGRIVNRRLWSDDHVRNEVLVRVYHALLNITAEKRSDLLSMLPFLLPAFRGFYERLT